MLHGLDRGGDVLGGIVGNAVGDARREALFGLGQFRPDSAGGGERVGAGELGDHQADGRFAVQEPIDAVVRGPELDARHVAQADHPAFVEALDDNVAKLLRCGEPALGLQAKLERRTAMAEGRLADRACGDLDVLVAHGADDLIDREVKGGRPVRVDPDAHVVVAGAEHAHAANTGDAVDPVEQLNGRIVRQVLL